MALLLTFPRAAFGSGECEQIGIPMCQVSLYKIWRTLSKEAIGGLMLPIIFLFQNIGYNFTRLPNQFNHETQEEVNLKVFILRAYLD